MQRYEVPARKELRKPCVPPVLAVLPVVDTATCSIFIQDLPPTICTQVSRLPKSLKRLPLGDGMASIGVRRYIRDHCVPEAVAESPANSIQML